MKRLIDLASLRRHPMAGQAMVELLEYRGEVLSVSEAIQSCPQEADWFQTFDSLKPLFVETLVREGVTTVIHVGEWTTQTPYTRSRQRVFEIEHRAGFPSVIGIYPEYEYRFQPVFVRCDHCGQRFADDKIEIDCDGEGLVAPCPSCGGSLRGFEPLEETLEQAFERARNEGIAIPSTPG